MWAQFYEEHEGKDFYPRLIEYMASGPVVAFQLANSSESDVSVVAKWRAAIGPTNCTSGLRKKYGTGTSRNAFHGSDSDAAAQRELALFQQFFET